MIHFQLALCLRAPTGSVSCLLFLGTEDSVDGSAADRAMALESRLSIFHSNPLSILDLSLFFALYTIIFCHDSILLASKL
jgi:hypothetical protein